MCSPVPFITEREPAVAGRLSIITFKSFKRKEELNASNTTKDLVGRVRKDSVNRVSNFVVA